MMATTMALAVTERLGVFYLLAAVGGVQRACLFGLPFVVVKDIVQAMVSHDDDDDDDDLIPNVKGLQDNEDDDDEGS